MTREQKFFWQQYRGLVKALDLPADYKLKDTRIYCVNKDCYVKDKCVFWERFLGACDTFGHSHFSMMRKAVIRDQKGHIRSDWDENYPMLDYRNASFGFCAKQFGTKPCSCYAAVNADNKV